MVGVWMCDDFRVKAKNRDGLVIGRDGKMKRIPFMRARSEPQQILLEFGKSGNFGREWIW